MLYFTSEKKYKKVLSILLTVTILCSNAAILTHAAELSPEQYLKSIGVPDEYLANISEYEINDIYNDYKDKPGVSFNSMDTYYMEDENPGGELQTRGTISSSSLKITIATFNHKLIDKSDNTTTLVMVDVRVSYQWLKAPKIKNTDSITLDWNHEKFYYKESSFEAKSLYDQIKYSGSNVKDVVYSTTSKNPKKVIAGSILWDYPFAVWDEITNYHGYAKFTLYPYNTIYQKNAVVDAFYYNYVHSTNPLPISISYSIKGFSIELNAGLLSDSMGGSYEYRF